jgi:hypothetical protein
MKMMSNGSVGFCDLIAAIASGPDATVISDRQ